MARVTVEDCLERVENRFVLIKLATARAREIRQGKRRLFETSNKAVVQSLREIAEGLVDLEENSRSELNAKLRKKASRYDRS